MHLLHTRRVKKERKETERGGRQGVSWSKRIGVREDLTWRVC